MARFKQKHIPSRERKVSIAGMPVIGETEFRGFSADKREDMGRMQDFELKQPNTLRTAKEILSDQKMQAPIARWVERSAQMVVFGFTASVATGDGKYYLHIDPRHNSYKLVDAHARVITAGISGKTEVQIHNETQSVDMLSTPLRIDTGETGSDTALPPDIKNHATLPTSLVSVWLSDGSGIENDLHGANDLTDNNSVTLTTGKNGHAGDFEEGDSEYLSITDGAQSGLDITGNLSVSAWLKLESFDDVESVAAKHDDLGGSNLAYWVFLQLDGANKKIGMETSANGSSASQVNITDNTLTTGVWYHIVWVYDASAGSVEIYKNGSSLGSASGLTTSIFNGAADFNIGAMRNGVNHHFDGILHQVAIWSKKLTSGEVQDLYNNGSGVLYENTGQRTYEIDVKKSFVFENDLIRVDVDSVQSEAPAGLIVTLGFQKI